MTSTGFSSGTPGTPDVGTALGVLVPVPGALPDSWIVSRCTRFGS